MHDPDTMVLSIGPLTIWHHDPCKDGSDDSCGWFKRAKHGDPAMLKKIRSAIEFSFTRVWEYRKDDWDDEKKKAGVPADSIHYLGYFMPNGEPNFSVHGIVLNMFFDAIHAYYGHNWRKSRAWMQRNLFDILHFAENPTDSLRDGITGEFRMGTNEKWNREDALDSYASCLYGWILREQQAWYQHPRWHVHHWRININWWWFVPRALDRKLRPEFYGCVAVNTPPPKPE